MPVMTARSMRRAHLLMLTGLSYDEARARMPASAALDDHDPEV